MSREHEHEHEVAVADNIRIEKYETPAEPGWTDRPKAERKAIHLAEHTPSLVTTTSNVTCVGLHEYLPTLLNYRNDPDKVFDHPNQVAFGSSTTTPTPSDTSLGNRVGAVSLTDPADTNAEWSTTELVGALELNGENLREVGVESEQGVLYNHTLLSNPLEPKTNSDELIITINLRFQAP